jgi:hypothetical protein
MCHYFALLDGPRATSSTRYRAVNPVRYIVRRSGPLKAMVGLISSSARASSPAEGFPVSPYLARTLRDVSSKLASHPESRRIYLRKGRFFQPNDIIHQPELAETLQRLQTRSA